MQTGIVKRWFSEKGYGFIRRETGADVFVHFRALTGAGRRDLIEGERVSFEVEDTPKGPMATFVVREDQCQQ